MNQKRKESCWINHVFVHSPAVIRTENKKTIIQHYIKMLKVLVRSVIPGHSTITLNNVLLSLPSFVL